EITEAESMREFEARMAVFDTWLAEYEKVVAVPERIRKVVIGNLAGCASEERFAGEETIRDCWASIGTAVKLVGEHLASDPGNVPEIVETLKTEASQLVSRNWRAVSTLAEALCRQRQIPGDEAERIIARALQEEQVSGR